VVKEVEKLVEKAVFHEVIKPVDVLRKVPVLTTERVEVLKEVEVEVRIETRVGELRREKVLQPVDVVREVQLPVRQIIETEVDVAVPTRVPVIKVVQVEARPELYQRTAGGYKVWDAQRADINHALFRGLLEQWVSDLAPDKTTADATAVRAVKRRMDQLGLSNLGVAAAVRVRDVPAGLPPPVATGWGRWTESHRRAIYGPVGDGRGQRHIPPSSLEPGRREYTSGVTPTPVGPPDADSHPERGLWEVRKRQHQKGFGPHAFAPGGFPRPPMGKEERHFFASKAHSEATAGGHLKRTPLHAGLNYKQGHGCSGTRVSVAPPSGTAPEGPERHVATYAHASKSVRS